MITDDKNHSNMNLNDCNQSIRMDSPNRLLGICKSVSEFKKVCRIGEGTYGFVYKAVHRVTGNTVALKRIIMHNENQDGFPLTSLREIQTLQLCKQHINIVQLHEVVVGLNRDAIFLVFEYCEHDLSIILKSFKNPFKESEIKQLILQLLSALKYLHRHWIVHRDIKLSNLLYNSKGQLKLAGINMNMYHIDYYMFYYNYK